MINGGPVTGVLNGISKGFTGGSMENHLDMVKSGLSFDGDILEKKWIILNWCALQYMTVFRQRNLTSGVPTCQSSHGSKPEKHPVFGRGFPPQQNAPCEFPMHKWVSGTILQPDLCRAFKSKHLVTFSQMSVLHGVQLTKFKMGRALQHFPSQTSRESF